jgi:hypothetical protein
MNRAERRAAERANHTAHVTADAAPSPTVPEAPTQPAQPQPEPSAARLAANRANAQHSTGPTSPTGKAKVSVNAVKTGLTGRTVLLRTEDAAQYEAFLLTYQTQFQPVGPEEIALLQSITDIRWRLDRIPGLEIALLTMGHRENAEREPEDQEPHPELLELQIRMTHEKHFRNLHIQENRLVRRREKEMAELKAMQEARKAKETEELTKAAQAQLLAQHRKQPCNLAELDFVFSTQQVAAHLASLSPARRQQLLQDALKASPEAAQAAA